VSERGAALRVTCGAVGDCDVLSRGEVMTQQLWQLSATEIAQRVRQREVSAREVADAALARLDAVNPAINAVVEHRPDDVRRQADEVNRAIARSRGDDPGPLAGVPVTVKINVDIEPTAVLLGSAR